MKLIAGPCVLEKFTTTYEIAEELYNILWDYADIDFYFKASCVKDNRTSTDNYNGPGFEAGINQLQIIKRDFHYKITTDFHTINQIEKYGDRVDLIQIPAYLSRQQSLMDCASRTGTPIHVKKPQYLGPIETLNLINNIPTRQPNIIVSDRGTMLGYDKVFMDPRHIPILQASRATSVLVDATHPNKNYPLGGMEMVEALVMSYIAAGADGMFIETHPTPHEALCDHETMYPLKGLGSLVRRAYELYTFINR